MKKLNLIWMIASASLIVGACNSNKDSKAVADSANATKDTTKVAAGDTTKIGYQTNGVNKDDAKFAVEAASGGMAEVELGQLAEQKGSSKQVKDFGAMMVKDHSKANAELMELAKKQNITLPTVIGADEQKIKDELSAKSGADFDKAYISDMIDDHKQDIKTFDDAQKTCKTPAIKAFAAQTLPTLKMHLDAIQKIHDSMK